MALEREDRDAIVRAISDGFAAAQRQQSQDRTPSGGRSGGGMSFGRGSAQFTGALGDATGMITRAGGSISDFTKDIANLSGSIPIIGDLTKAFGMGVTGVVSYLEVTNDTFKSLSKVGAGFNGDLGALRAAAASTRMPLDAFANLVGRNAGALAGLGAGVNDGAKRFAELSRAMFEDGQTIQGLTNLGYSLEESNELLLENVARNRRGIRLSGMNEGQVAQATLKMAENMAFIAEVTGESAEQQRQEMLDAQRDGKNIAAMRLAEINGARDVSMAFDQAFQGLNVAGDQAQALLQDYLQVNAPASKMTANFESMNPEIAATIREMARLSKASNAQISPQEKQARMAELNARVQAQVAAAGQDQTRLIVATTGQLSDVGQSMADFYGSTENYQNAVEEQMARMGEGATREDAARELERQRRSAIAAQRTGTGTPGQQVSAAINQATIDLANGANQVHMTIARNLGANTELADTARKALEAIGVAGIGAGALAEGGAEALIPGQPNDKQLQEENQFASVFTPLINNNALLTRITNIDKMEGFLRNLAEQEGNPELTRLLDNLFGGGRAQGGPISAGKIYRVGEEGPETIIPGIDGTVIPNMENAMDNTASTFRSVMNSVAPQMQQMGQNMQTAISNQQGISDQTSNTLSNMSSTFSQQLASNQQDSRQETADSITGITSTFEQQLGSMQRTLGQENSNSLSGMSSMFEQQIGSVQSRLGEENSNSLSGMQSIFENQLGRIQGSLGQETSNSLSGMQSIFDRQFSTILPNLRNTIQRTRENPQMAQGLQTAIDSFRSEVTSNGPQISTDKMEQALDSLNQSMLQLIQINNNVARNSAKQAEAIRGAGNLMQGVAIR